MPIISNRASLLSAFEDFLVDESVLSQADLFLQQAEERIWSDVRLGLLEQDVTLTPVAGVVTLPDNFLEPIAIALDSNPSRTFTLTSREQYLLDSRNKLSGEPDVYTILRNTLLFAPTPVSDVRVFYYAKVQSMADNMISATELIQRHPSLYLYAMLDAAAPYVRESMEWGARFEAYLARVHAADYRRYNRPGAEQRRY